jgi:hypothetical protein
MSCRASYIAYFRCAVCSSMRLPRNFRPPHCLHNFTFPSFGRRYHVPPADLYTHDRPMGCLNPNGESCPRGLPPFQGYTERLLYECRINPLTHLPAYDLQPIQVEECCQIRPSRPYIPMAYLLSTHDQAFPRETAGPFDSAPLARHADRRWLQHAAVWSIAEQYPPTSSTVEFYSVPQPCLHPEVPSPLADSRNSAPALHGWPSHA